MGRVTVSLAMSDYDHVRDLTSGVVEVDGIELVPLTSMPVEEIFHRFIKYREWDVSEMSLAKFVAMTASGEADFVGLPVFPSRMFRISSAYVLADSPIEQPEQLRGRRVGIPEWAQTAAVYSRGWLSETVGLGLDEIEWVQAGVNEPGRSEKVSVRLPDGVRCTPTPDKSLTAMLLAGEIDAIFSAHPPAPFEAGDGRLRHLVRDHRAAEEAYYRATGIFPIMHIIAVRRALLDRHPWIARNLFKGFLEARARSIHRLRELTASRFPLPWAAAQATAAEELFGELFPYGLEPNRATLTAFLRFAAAQGLTRAPLEPEALFAPSLLSDYRI